LAAGAQVVFKARSGTGKAECARVEVQSSAGNIEIYFWKPERLPESAVNAAGELGFPFLRGEMPPDDFALEELLTIARRERPPFRSRDWIELYRRAALFEPSMFALIPMKGDHVEERSLGHALSSPNASGSTTAIPFHPETFSLDEMVQRHGRVVLTAPAGGGKTTLLNSLLRKHLSRMNDGRGDGHIVFAIRLGNVGRVKAGANVAKWIAGSVRDCISRLDIRDLEQVQLPAGRRARRLNVQTLTKEEVLAEIGKQVEVWFESGQLPQDKMLLLLDGYNEAPLDSRASIDRGIEVLTAKGFHFILASRVAELPSLSAAVQEFRLQTLSDRQIVYYLRQWFPGKGRDLFDSCIASDSGILAMAQNPFFLNLIANWIHMNPTRPIPDTHGHLIRWFVRECAYRKRRTDEVGIPDIPDRVKDRVLGEIGYVMLRNVTLEPHEEPIRYPMKSSDQSLEGWPLHEVLDVAEAEGLLRVTETNVIHGGRDYEFGHDYFRDYFASLYLHGLRREVLVREMRELSEFFAWDNSIIMFFEHATQKEQENVAAAFDCISRLAPILASRCAYAWRYVDRQRVVALLGVTCSDYATALHRWYFTKESASDVSLPAHFPDKLVGAAAYVLGRLPKMEVARLARSQPVSSLREQAAILVSLSWKEEERLPLLLDLVRRPFPNCTLAIWGLSLCQSPKAWQAMVDRLSIESSAPSNDAEWDIFHILSASNAVVPVDQALQAYERAPSWFPPRCKGALLKALANAPQEQVGLVLKLLDDPRELVRIYACAAVRDAKWRPPDEAITSRLRDASVDLLCSSFYHIMLQVVVKCVTPTYEPVLLALLERIVAQDSDAAMGEYSLNKVTALRETVGRICSALSRIPGQRSFDLRLKVASNPYSWFRREVTSGLIEHDSTVMNALTCNPGKGQGPVEEAAVLLLAWRYSAASSKGTYSDEGMKVMVLALRELCQSSVWTKPAHPPPLDAKGDISILDSHGPVGTMVADIYHWFYFSKRAHECRELIDLMHSRSVPLVIRRAFKQVLRRNQDEPLPPMPELSVAATEESIGRWRLCVDHSVKERRIKEAIEDFDIINELCAYGGRRYLRALKGFPCSPSRREAKGAELGRRSAGPPAVS